MVPNPKKMMVAGTGRTSNLILLLSSSKVSLLTKLYDLVQGIIDWSISGSKNGLSFTHV